MNKFIKSTSCLLTILTLLTGISLQARQNEKTLSLSLEECIIKGLEKNLDIAVNVLNPELSDLAVVASREVLPNNELGFQQKRYRIGILQFS